MNNVPSAEPLGIVGIILWAGAAALQFLDIHSGAFVAIGSIVGAICAIISVARAKQRDKWINDIVKKQK